MLQNRYIVCTLNSYYHFVREFLEITDSKLKLTWDSTQCKLKYQGYSNLDLLVSCSQYKEIMNIYANTLSSVDTIFTMYNQVISNKKQKQEELQESSRTQLSPKQLYMPLTN